MTDKSADSSVVWQGRPSIGSYAILYGVLAVIAMVILDGLELWVGSNFHPLSSAFGASFKLGPIPYGVEVATAAIVLLVYVAKVIGLLIFKARHSYELHTDGIYFNRGIANLSNTFVSAMAFSDAKLVRTIGMRLVGRSVIIVEANDGRKFELRMIKDGPQVQGLIRKNLGHPTVRLES